MSFVSIIRDYVEMLNQLSDSLSTDFTLKTFLVENFFYVLQTVKLTVVYILSFQWIRDFTLLPTIIPQISSSIFRETFFLETPSKIFFEFLEIPSLDQNKFILGFFNSFFFTLPISIIHLISLRRLIIQGIPAGVISISGYIFGQFLFLICVIFGIRFILVPWLTFEPLNYIVGILLIFRIIYSMAQESLTPLSGWDWKNPKYQNFFITSFALAWCEQTSIFQYLGNITITSNPTILEGFSANSAITSLANHVTYLFGIFVGSIVFTFAWGFIFLKLRDFIVSYTPLFTSSFIQLLNKTTFILVLAFSLSSIPYYGLDYLFTGPLGFISQDRTFANTIFSQYNVKDSIQFLGSNSSFQGLDIDVAPFDRGRYLIFPDNPQFLSFEDLNYKGESDWTTRVDKLSGVSDSKAGFLTLSKILKTKTAVNRSISPTLEKKSSNFEKFEKNNSLISENQLDQASDTSVLQTRFRDWYHLPIREEDTSERVLKTPIENIFRDFTTSSFPGDFLRFEANIEKDVEQKIKQKYYSNPVYKNLLSFDIDLFLNRQPGDFKLTNSQEIDLYTKRCILTSYYDSLRAYSKLPYTEDFENFFDGSKSFSNKVYNQQFKGTLRSVRRLFALTLNPNTEKFITSLSEFENFANNQQQILKFDQPLFEFSSTQKFSPYHEELSITQSSTDRTLGKQSLFIKDSLTRPLYAGWDENLRKFVITNKLLPRNTAGYEINLTSEIGKKFSSTSWTVFSSLSNKNKQNLTSKDPKKPNFVGSQKIRFTSWPLSMKQVNQPKNKSKIPYVTLFFSQTHLENQNGEDQPDFRTMTSMPSNRETIERKNSISTTFENLFDYLAPQRGGFVWPGNNTWNFSSLPKS